jgi:hypothetical protein
LFGGRSRLPPASRSRSKASIPTSTTSRPSLACRASSTCPGRHGRSGKGPVSGLSRCQPGACRVASENQSACRTPGCPVAANIAAPATSFAANVSPPPTSGTRKIGFDGAVDKLNVGFNHMILFTNC